MKTIELERAAYIEGGTRTAELLARIAELEAVNLNHQSTLESIASAASMGAMNAKQCAGAAYETLVAVGAA